MYKGSVGPSSTTNPKPRGETIPLPAQANLHVCMSTQQKAGPLRCLALRTRGGRLKNMDKTIITVDSRITHG